MCETTTKRFYLGIAEDDGVSMAVLGDEKGNVIGKQQGRSFAYHRLGMAAARDNLHSLVRSIPGISRADRLHTVTLAMQSCSVHREDQLCDLVHSVVYTRNVKFHSFADAAMLGMPGRKPEIVVLTETVGCIVGRSGAGTICRPAGGGGAVDMVKAALRRIEQEPHAFGMHEVRHCLLDWLGHPCHSRARVTACAIDALAETGNPVALEIVLHGAGALIRGVAAMIRQLGILSPLIGLCGCVALDSQIVQERFCSVMGLLYPNCRIEPAEHAPARGAYISSLVPSVIST